MRETIRDIDRLRHIDECIEHINDYLKGKTFEDMKADVMCFHAVVYNIMIIGEAANLLTIEFRNNHSEVPWRDIVDMRNVLLLGSNLPINSMFLQYHSFLYTKVTKTPAFRHF
ncbi:MAG: DUF86 domain-containing protein [Prevotella sp.]|nr:DUF86 domain-containing protein [Prevotella sp.]